MRPRPNLINRNRLMLINLGKVPGPDVVQGPPFKNFFIFNNFSFLTSLLPRLLSSTDVCQFIRCRSQGTKLPEEQGVRT